MLSSNKLSSPIAGCMRWGVWGACFDMADYRAMIELCLETGITSFDHADIYGDYTTEYEFGAALKETPSLRQEIQLITKCGIQLPNVNKPEFRIKSYNTSAAHITASVNKSLENFGTDYIDVLLIHRPDPLLNPHEVAEAVAQLKKAGKILQFGISNFMPQQTNTLSRYTTIEYNQLEISITQLTPFINGCLDNCIEHNITPLAWASLGGGILTDQGHPNFRNIIAVASALARKYNTGVNQILIAFLLAHPAGIIPIMGSTKIDRLIQAKDAAVIQISREDWYSLYLSSTDEELA